MCFGPRETLSAESLDTDIQYRNSHLGEMKEGHTYRIHGHIPKNGNIFTVDFVTNIVEDDVKNIALRLIASVDENFLKRCCSTGTNWSNEEVHSYTPYKLQDGEHIMIEVLILKHEFYIALNGFHCARFVHRHAYTKINVLEIRGDIIDVIVDRKVTAEYPQRPLKSPHFGRIGKAQSENYYVQNPSNKYYDDDDEIIVPKVSEDEPEVYDVKDYQRPSKEVKTKQNYYVKDHLPLPYFASFEEGFLAIGYTLIITGYVRIDSKNFTVALQTGPQYWPEPGKCYEVNFKFYNKGQGKKPPHKYREDEIIEAKAGDKIKIKLKRECKGFSGFVNDKVLDLRPYKINPKFITTAVIRGDLKLMNIQIESN